MIIDHILVSFPKTYTQQGITGLGGSDHQLICCTKKFSRIKRNTHKQIKLRFFMHYSANVFEESLTDIIFSSYQNFDDTTQTYDDFIQKILVAIDMVAPT